MSVDSIRSALTAAISNSRISRAEVQKIFTAAKDGGTIDADEKAELQKILDTHGSKFTVAGKAEFSRLFGTTPTPPPVQPPVQPPAPVVPTGPDAVTYAANRQPWTTTYWPMAGNGDAIGSASSNLWAKDGALDKLDGVLKARSGKVGARDFELKPNLNWLINKESGHYIPSSYLNEADAETTTGVDFNNNGTIDKDVKWDFIDSRGQFGKDGKTDGTMSVGWWGSCDKVARAGILFAEPKKDVTLNGVTFTAQDIKGLLTVLSDSQGGGSDFVGNRYDAQPDTIVLKNGQTVRGQIQGEVDFSGKHNGDLQIAATLPPEVKVTLLDGTEKVYKAAELSSIGREDKLDDAGLFHTTIAEWLKSGRPAVMDRDSGEHVWNYNFYKADDLLFKNGLKPSWADQADLKKGFNGPAGDGKISYVERTVELGGGGGTQNYRYWLEEKAGKIVNSGWADGSSSPDFLWRPQTEAAFTGPNARNPFVDPKLVKELYDLSIAP